MLTQHELGKGYLARASQPFGPKPAGPHAVYSQGRLQRFPINARLNAGSGFKGETVMRFALGLLGVFAIAAWAQPVHLIVPYPPGGASDILARYLVERSRQAIVVENVPGATGAIGAERVARAKPDGRTLLFGNTTPNGIDPGWTQIPRSDHNWRLKPILGIAAAPYVMATPLDGKVLLVEDVIRLPNYGTDGVGSLGHLIMAKHGAQGQHIPYRGGADVARAVAAGEVYFGMVPAPVAVAWNSRLRVIGRTGRLWWGLFAPDGSPHSPWADEVAEISRLPETRRGLETQGYTPMVLSEKDFADFVRAEQIQYRDMVDNYLNRAELRKVD
jgi:tripartite-type tricarboxylate transporter receptor subunit TctC